MVDRLTLFLALVRLARSSEVQVVVGDDKSRESQDCQVSSCGLVFS